MHRFIFRWRFLALAAPLAAIAALVFLGGGSGTPRTFATGGTPGATPNLTGVSCSDVYLGPTIIGLTMSRIEPHGGTTVTTSWDVTTVSYLGYAGPGGIIPLGSPGPSCQSTTLAAGSAAEANRFGGAFQVPYSNQYGFRPTAVGTYTQTNAYGAGTGDLTFSSCGYSESQGKWVRIDSDSHIVKVGTGANIENDGTGTLYLGAGAPAAIDAVDINGDGVLDAAKVGTNCSNAGCVVGGNPCSSFPFTSKSYSRDARTSHTAVSDVLCGTDTSCVRNRALSIAADPDNSTTLPKTKSTVMNPDTSDTLADNWSGDGCTDWDKLGNGFMPGSLPLLYPPSYTWANTPVNGMDPFNPYDCNLNYTATISLTTTIFHNTGGAGSGAVAAACTTGGIPDCNYFGFRCIGSMTDAKTGTPRALSYRLGCYSDSPVTTVNSTLSGGNSCGPAPRDQCGDGKAGVAPPGCVDTPTATPTCAQSTAGSCPTLPCAASRFIYTGIDPATYPVVDSGAANNYFNATTNLIHLGGCFAGFGGGAYGNVYGSSTVDAHTGAGSFQIYLSQTLSDCTNGTPMGTPLNGQIEIVVLRTEKGLTPAQMYDSDRDGCPDSQELLASQGAGGERDPYNPWDYFNPEKVNTPNAQTVADILKVVGQYGHNQGNVTYTTATDRTAVLGGRVWTLGAPDGQQTVADILAAVKQYNHNCMYSAP